MTKRKIITFAILANLLFSTAFLFGKIALEVFPPVMLAGLRSIIAAFMILLLIRRNPFKAVRSKLKLVIIMSLINPFIGFTIYNIGLNYLPGSYVAMIKGSSPAFVVMVATLLIKDEHITKKNFISLLLGILGVVILSLSRQRETASIDNTFIIGFVLLVISNFANAIEKTLIKKRITIEQVLDVNVVINFIGGSLILILSFFMDEKIMLSSVDLRITVSLIYLSFVSAGGSYLWNTIIVNKGVKLNNISVWNFLIPASGAVLSWIFIDGDDPNIISVICLLLVVCSILVSVINISKVKKIKKVEKCAIEIIK